MKLLIIDGHALVFRAYYAFQTANLTNSITKAPSGAVFGFFRMFFKILEDFTPSHVALTFDPGTPLERSKMYEAYKANRAPMPEDLRPQIKEVLDISGQIGFTILQVKGIEADDIIGTICKRYGKGENEILIFSGDKDLFQLLNNNIKLLRGKKGASEFIIIDEAWVKQELGVTPSQIPDYMGIVGDTADNIPGVKGIGEKGAAKLISEYGSLEQIYDSLSTIKNPSMKEKLIQSKENAFLSRDLARLDNDIDLDIDLHLLKLPNYLDPKKVQVFKDMGYNVLYRDLSRDSQKAGYSMESGESEIVSTSIQKTEANRDGKGNYKRIKNLDEFKNLIKQLKKQKILCVDTETTSPRPMWGELIGLSFSYIEKEGFYIPVKHPQSLFQSECLDWHLIVDDLKEILENPKISKLGQNIKYDAIVLKNYGIDIGPISFDTMLASYVLSPDSRRHNMDDMAKDILGYKTITYDELTGSGKKRIPLYQVDLDRVSEYAAEDADITFRLYQNLEPELKKQNLNSVTETIEIPLIPVLRDIEMTGVAIDEKYFKKLSKEFSEKIDHLTNHIFGAAGEEFNINSTKELQVILYEKLKLPQIKKTATGISTDHSVLEALVEKHPIIGLLLDYRKLSKLLSTYVDSLPTMIHPQTRRIHTSYNQTIAATGRLSSTDPNLQNIPIKDEEGRMIRKGFVPSSADYEILSLDYSQIELRIMAHFCKDKNMLDAYNKNIDIHTRTASALFGIQESEVSSEQRNKAKIVNFSVIYGTTAFGLADQMKVSRTEAGMFIDKYFLQYPGVKEYMEKVSKECFENGYVETLTGRRRYIPEIKSSRRQEVEAAKRIAINSPIQGTSADMIKLAMIRIHESLKKEKLKSKMIMQVHDELVFEVHKSEKEKVLKIAKKEMENVVRLEVPITVQGKFGNNWEQAH